MRRSNTRSKILHALLRWAGMLIALGGVASTPLQAKKDKEKPAKIEISGLGWWSDREMRVTLERLLGAERGPTLAANAIEDAMFLLMSGIQERGFRKPTIVVEMTDPAGHVSSVTLDAEMNAAVPRDTQAAAVHFKVKPGIQYSIAAVNFKGLHLISTDIARGFFVGENTLFTGRAVRAYTPSRIGRGTESLEAELRSRGYAEAKVQAGDVDINDQTGEVKVTIEVNEGVIWMVSEVREATRGASDWNFAPLQRFVGQPWTEQLQQDAATEIRRHFLGQGFADVRVRMTPEPSPVVEGHKDVVVLARIATGEKITLGNVKFENAGKTKESVLRRRVHASTGEPLNVSELENARYRISRLGVYDRVDLRIDGDGTTRDAVFSLQPGRQLEVNLLAGYGSYEEVRGGVEVRQYNLFGHGHQARGLLVESMKSTRGEYSYTVPEIFGESIDGTAKLFGLQREEVAFERQEYGGSLLLSAPIGRLGVNATAGYTFQALRNRNNQLETSAIDNKQVTVASVDLGLTRDRRDNPLIPRRGYRAFARLEAASRGLGGEAEYQRLEFGGSYHTGWGNGRWVHLSAAHGLITTWGTTDERLPVNKRFYPGGDGSIRSFQVGEAAPRGADGKFIGAKSYMTASIEFEQALAEKWSVVLFTDALGSTTQLKHYPFDETLFALGTGIRYQTLIGPIRLEYGRNLKTRVGDPGGTLLLSIGFPF
jgi:outer membrane protein insertion porin family